MVVVLHFEVENLGISGSDEGNESEIEKLEDSIANIGKLGLNFGYVVTDDKDMVVVASALLLLLDGGNAMSGGHASTDDVLVSKGKEISLFNGELLLVEGSKNLLLELNHLLVALRKLGHVNILLMNTGSGFH
ncbi:uncharacterized protein LOC120086446 [Benincasa hispida]|uniref:uncharacterized protein LOC120086446 n=1 Tax=Benincasa hispida TaxID=102211 RepID=UPI0019004C13|nr:uncharacterized protein LOC120086446 [Benincasa hispida]